MKIPFVLKKLIGIAFILMSISFVGGLILNLPILATQFATAIKENLGYYWGEFGFTFFINVIFWIITYYMFRYGRTLYRTKY